MAFVSYLAGVVYHGLRTFTTDARRYGELSFDERHIFWKKVQTAAFLALMPLFLALGLAWRLATSGSGHFVAFFTRAIFTRVEMQQSDLTPMLR